MDLTNTSVKPSLAYEIRNYAARLFLLIITLVSRLFNLSCPKKPFLNDIKNQLILIIDRRCIF